MNMKHFYDVLPMVDPDGVTRIRSIGVSQRNTASEEALPVFASDTVVPGIVYSEEARADLNARLKPLPRRALPESQPRFVMIEGDYSGIEIRPALRVKVQSIEGIWFVEWKEGNFASAGETMKDAGERFIQGLIRLYLTYHGALALPRKARRQRTAIEKHLRPLRATITKP